MRIKDSLKTGFSFGLTSGIITTLGLIIGLNYSTYSKAVVLGGILVIAIADAFSDALGIHVSEESENKHTSGEIWASTLFTFLAKFVIALTFIIPILLFPLSLAVIVSIIWGLSILSIFSYYISRGRKPLRVVMEHLLIATAVIIATYYIGYWINIAFN